jgi:hypothetical protein
MGGFLRFRKTTPCGQVVALRRHHCLGVHAITGVRCLAVIDDAQAGRKVKTESSVRAAPVHPKLLRIGFIEFLLTQMGLLQS